MRRRRRRGWRDFDDPDPKSLVAEICALKVKRPLPNLGSGEPVAIGQDPMLEVTLENTVGARRVAEARVDELRDYMGAVFVLLRQTGWVVRRPRDDEAWVEALVRALRPRLMP